MAPVILRKRLIAPAIFSGAVVCLTYSAADVALSNQKEFLNLYYKDETDQRNIELKKRPSPR